MLVLGHTTGVFDRAMEVIGNQIHHSEVAFIVMPAPMKRCVFESSSLVRNCFIRAS